MLALGACGGGGGSARPPAKGVAGVLASIGKQVGIAAEVPPDIRSRNAIEVGTDAMYAPNEYVDPLTGQVVGWEVDLGKAIGKVLGLNFVFNNTDFATIIPDVGSRYDVGISSIGPTADREKTVDFVTYYQAGQTWFTKKGAPAITGVAELCGKTIAVQTGAPEETDAFGFLGKKPDGSVIPGDTDHCAPGPDITVHTFSKQTDANLDVIAGRAAAGWSDSPVADYQVKLSGELSLAGPPCSVAPYGFAVPKGSALAMALQDAIKFLIARGYYGKILRDWSVGDGAITAGDVGVNVNSSGGPGSQACVPTY